MQKKKILEGLLEFKEKIGGNHAFFRDNYSAMRLIIATQLIKFVYPDWLTCKKSLLGGHGKARHTISFDFKKISHIVMSLKAFYNLLLSPDYL